MLITFLSNSFLDHRLTKSAPVKTTNIIISEASAKTTESGSISTQQQSPTHQIPRTNAGKAIPFTAIVGKCHSDYKIQVRKP